MVSYGRESEMLPIKFLSSKQAFSGAWVSYGRDAARLKQTRKKGRKREGEEEEDREKETKKKRREEEE
jgi:hypothetical protein